jgi:hypothetical protein
MLRYVKPVSPHAFPHVVVFIQPVDLHAFKVTPGNDTQNFVSLDDGEMTEATIIHLPQRVDRPSRWRHREGIRCHRTAEWGGLSALAFCERPYRVAAGEDAEKTLLLIDHEHRTRAMHPHALASFPDGRLVGKRQEILTFNDVGEFSVGHGALPFSETLELQRRPILGCKSPFRIDPHQATC